MKSLILFARAVLIDLGTLCGTSTSRDFQTVSVRHKDEGLSFLTITLADFGRDFQKSLDQGSVGHDHFVGFSRSGGLPRFLGGFLDRVFDRGSGRLLEEPCLDAIFAIRQFTLMWAKMNIKCSPARERKAARQYLQVEQDLRVSDTSFEGIRKDSFERLSGLLWANVLQAVDEDVYYERLIPRHGPGSTADRLKGNLKWMQQEWTQRLDSEFHVGTHLFSNPGASDEGLASVDILDPGAERPVKVIFVPKTLKTPRVIAMEPTCMQYVQQGVLRGLVKAIEADDFASSLIGFSTQVPNQELAREGSSKGNLATLDLSEASDRVSNQHVRALLRRHPNLAAGVDACRSRKADVLGHGVIRLAKFASMGSALTFPVEAMVFTTIVFMGIEQSLNRQLTRRDIQSFRGQVRVYGDDIIVPVDHVPAVVEQLEAFGLRVNSNKSFWTGKFRESCGKDYYDGHDITVVRLRSVFPTHRTHVSEIVSLVETRNQFYFAGLWISARHLDKIIGKVLPHYPVVGVTSPVLGRQSFLGYETQKLCPELHRPLVKGYQLRAKPPKSLLDGWPALLKCLTQLETKEDSLSLQGGPGSPAKAIELYPRRETHSLPGVNGKHLEHAGRPKSVTLRLGWYPSF